MMSDLEKYYTLIQREKIRQTTVKTKYMISDFATIMTSKLANYSKDYEKKACSVVLNVMTMFTPKNDAMKLQDISSNGITVRHQRRIKKT